jgi:hypothetical protein
VQIGRPVVWGLATDGERGVADVLSILHQELELAMAPLWLPIPRRNSAGPPPTMTLHSSV